MGARKQPQKTAAPAAHKHDIAPIAVRPQSGRIKNPNPPAAPPPPIRERIKARRA